MELLVVDPRMEQPTVMSHEEFGERLRHLAESIGDAFMRSPCPCDGDCAVCRNLRSMSKNLERLAEVAGQ